MSGYIPDALKQLVRTRAYNRCEYCHLAQAGQAATFHIDHIIPVTQAGATSADNLALACVSCSLRKAAKLRAIDPLSQQEVRLYHPRQEDWTDHFTWDGVTLIGQTPTGRATIEALQMNRPLLLAIRAEEQFWGRHP